MICQGILLVFYRMIFLCILRLYNYSVCFGTLVVKEPLIGHLERLLYPAFNKQILQLEAICLQTTK